MPVQPTYPGVYIEELPSGVHTITGVATSITAFIGRALRGPVNKAMTINSYADFERIYGGLWLYSTLGYAVQDFFNNGGSTAIIVRLFSPTDSDLRTTRTILQNIATLAASAPSATLVADMQKIADAASTFATIKAAQTVMKAVQAAVGQLGKSPIDAVKEAASATVDALNQAAQAIASTEDQSAKATAQTTAKAMSDAVAANEPDKTAGNIVATAAATAAQAANATIATVKKAAADAQTALNTDLQNVANATPTAQSTAQTIRAAADALADPSKSVANVFATAAETEAKKPKATPDTVKQAATTALTAWNTAMVNVIDAIDPVNPQTAQSTAQAIRKAADALPDPNKATANVVATAAEAAAQAAGATPATVKQAATDALAPLNTDLQNVANATPTAQSTAQAMRAAADALAAPNKAAAQLVASAAEAEAANQTDLTPVREAANTAVAEYISTLPVTRAVMTVGGMRLVAASQGSWGANLRVTIDKNNITPDIANNLNVPPDKLFNLTIADISPGGTKEQFPTLTVIDHPRRIDRVLEAQSQLLRWGGLGVDGNPALPQDTDMPQFPGTSTTVSDTVTTAEQALTDALSQRRKDRILGKDTTTDTNLVNQSQQDVNQARGDLLAIGDGIPISENEFTGPGTAEMKWGLFALEQVDLFNLLVIPPYKITSSTDWDVDDTLITEAVIYCEKRRAMLLVDAPSTWINKDTARSKFTQIPDPANPVQDIVSTRSKNAALFFPRIMRPNILRSNQTETFAASGILAGIFARTDAQRGVWKAPAGLEASLVGVQELSVNLTDAENGELNPLGINCLRAFPIFGPVVWGSRTLRGADAFADDYKYIPVRRTALFIEESLYRGTQWVVFEPNDEPLWSQIRLNVGAFMHNLFRQGAFQGQTPRDAYLVKCDSETTTQNDIDLGIVNILVGFAPLKPAEFVIIQIKQLTGQIQV